MKRVWWIAVSIALSGCGRTEHGGESSLQECATSGQCGAGFVCNAGRCAAAQDAAGTGGAPTNPADTGAGNAAGTGGRDAGVPDASVDAAPDAAPPEPDGGPRVDATASGICFGAPPRECGVLKQWPGYMAKDVTGRWTLMRALPIDGADGFAAIIRDGDEVIADVYLATLDARTGCAELASPKFDSRLSLYGIYRAISRGGTFAVLAQCMQRFGCGRTLFVNGLTWPDPAGTPSYELRDIDVAADGKVFVASAEYPESDGGTLEVLAERWLSPAGQVLAEGRHRDVPAQVQKVAVVPNGVALAVQTEGPLFYVQFQSNDFANTFTWAPAPGMRVHTLGSHPTFVGVAGGMNPYGVWLGVLHGEFGTSYWTQPRYELTRDDTAVGLNTFGVEVDDEGVANAVVWTSAGTYLLLDGWEDRPATPTPILDTGIPSTFGRMVVPAVSTQSDGTLLWAGELWGTYCRK